MKYFLFARVLCLCSCIPWSKPANCANFKNGKFKTKVFGSNYFIERSGNMQKEYSIHGKDTALSTLAVKWLDDCTYTLTPDEETRIRTKLPKNALITVHIISTTSNSYEQTGTANFSDKIYAYHFFKIN